MNVPRSDKKWPAIVVPCYNRFSSLERLLSQLLRADYPESSQVTLVLSVDGGGSKDVIALARSINWPFGEKRVIEHEKNLGLKAHILNCGNLTAEFGTIVVIEDDLLISPVFYRYVLEVQRATVLEEECLCGASLYAYRVNETTLVRFSPVEDGFDNYYLQMPSSWGQIWNASSWSAFWRWYTLNEGADLSRFTPNAAVAKWGKKKGSSWKRFFAAYMVAEGKFMHFPRVSYTDNSGESGTHHKGNAYFRTALAYELKDPLVFSKPNKSNAIYDQNFELSSKLIHRLYPELTDLMFGVCLNGSKLNTSQLNSLVLSASKPFQHPKTWGNVFYPVELNVLLDVPGDDIGFCRKEDFDPESRSKALVLSGEKIVRVRGGFCLFATSRRKKLLTFFLYLIRPWKAKRGE